MSTLDQQFARASVTCNPLPLIHVSDLFSLRSIQIDKTLRSIKECEHFKRHIVYFFYGKPAYKTRDLPFVDAGYDLPVVFIFKNFQDVPPIYRAFAIDTGAFFRGYYRGYFHKHQDVLNLEISSDQENILRFISSLYRNEDNYFAGKPDPSIEFGPMDFEMKGLLSLSRAIGRTSSSGDVVLDERGRSVEIQIDSEVALANKVRTIIYPSILRGDSEFLNFVDDVCPDFICHYETMDGVGSEGYSVRITDTVREAMRVKTVLP